MPEPGPEVIARLGAGYRFTYRVGPSKLFMVTCTVPAVFAGLFFLAGWGWIAALAVPVCWALAYIAARWYLNDEDRSLFPWLDTFGFG